MSRHRSPSATIASYCNLVRPDKYSLSAFVDFTSMGKHKSPRNARRSPVPSIPEPAARTTKNGRLVIKRIFSFSIGVHERITDSTPFGTPARTCRNSRSYWLDTYAHQCQSFLMTSVKVMSKNRVQRRICAHQSEMLVKVGIFV